MRPEDQLLAPEQFPELNREFYTARSGPHDYIAARVRALYLGTSDSDAIAAAAAEGFQVGTLRSAYPIDDGDEADAEREKRADFLVTESTVLLHHAGEALMRLYFAHVGRPDCPRIEVARLRFDAFTKRLAKMGNTLDSEQARSELMAVFTGRSGPREDGTDGSSREFWEKQCDGLVALLTTISDFLLRDRNLYNAAKHGIAVTSEGLSFALGGEPEGDELTDVALSADGPALHYLEVTGKKPNTRWQQSSTWVSAEANLALIHLVAEQIEALMLVGRARYVRDQTTYRVRGITRERVDEAKEAGGTDSVIPMLSIGRQLMYNPPPDKPAKKRKGGRGR